MKHKYILYILFTLFVTLNLSAQEKKTTNGKTDAIEGLQVYPNPTTTGKIYITTESNSNSREIELFDMLGKRVYATTLYNSNKEINLTNLNAGVYIIQIKENNATATRKLVIK